MSSLSRSSGSSGSLGSRGSSDYSTYSRSGEGTDSRSVHEASHDEEVDIMGIDFGDKLVDSVEHRLEEPVDSRLVTLQGR